MLLDVIADAWRNIRGHWFRLTLTGLGIAWGIALFICLTAIGNASRAHYRKQMEVIGPKVIYVFPASVARKGAPNLAPKEVVFDLDDPPRLPSSPLIDSAAPELWTGARVLKGGGHIKVVWTYGVAPAAQHIRNFEVDRGRFVNRRDLDQRRRVLVLGAKVAERLFGRQSALGRSVRLDGYPFRVVGVSKPKGEQLMNMGPKYDEQVLMPITTAQTLFTGSHEIGFLTFEPHTGEDGAEAIQRARTILSRHHYFHPNDQEALGFFNVRDAIRLIEGIEFALQVFLVGCGLLTLTVGGIGVMNIMLVAVAERTRELGLRKALGATHRDVALHVLSESVAVTVAAGFVGVGFGVGLIGILQMLRTSAGRMDVLTPYITVSPGLALTAFVVLVGTGITAGVVPALRAARLEPAVALRQD